MMTVVDAIQYIGKTQMGDVAFPEEVIRRYVEMEKGYLLICYGPDDTITEVDVEMLNDTVDGDIKAFCVGAIFTEDEVRDELYGDLDEAMENSGLTPEHFPVSYFRDALTHPEYEEQGLASKTTMHLASILMQQESTVLGPVWHRDDGNMDKILDKYPIEPLYTFEDYDYIEDADSCPVCETGECTCTFSLWGHLVDP